MNVLTMQHPIDDLERKLLQQQHELQVLARSLKDIGGGLKNPTGFGPPPPAAATTTMMAVSGVGAVQSESSTIGSVSSQSPPREFLAFAPAFFSQENQRVDPTFADESLVSMNSFNGNSNTAFQQNNLCPVYTSHFHTLALDESHSPPSSQAMLQQDFVHLFHFGSQSEDVKLPAAKKIRIEEEAWNTSGMISPPAAPTPIPSGVPSSCNTNLHCIGPSTYGQNYYEDNDVLSGRGGGTNIHPGNRFFRDLINMHRCRYLKSRKNDKPAMSRAIVQAIRSKGGKFLKRCDTTGLWYEIGDDAAREKTSQALRQRAPEIRKLLCETEQDDSFRHDEREVPKAMPQQDAFSKGTQQPRMESLMSWMAMEATPASSDSHFASYDARGVNSNHQSPTASKIGRIAFNMGEIGPAASSAMKPSFRGSDF